MLRDVSVRAPHMHDDAVEVHYRPDGIQRPRPPRGHFGIEIRRDFRDQRGRHIHTVQVAENILDVTCGHPLGIQ